MELPEIKHLKSHDEENRLSGSDFDDEQFIVPPIATRGRACLPHVLITPEHLSAHILQHTQHSNEPQHYPAYQKTGG